MQDFFFQIYSIVRNFIIKVELPTTMNIVSLFNINAKQVGQKPERHSTSPNEQIVVNIPGLFDISFLT